MVAENGSSEQQGRVEGKDITHLLSSLTLILGRPHTISRSSCHEKSDRYADGTTIARPSLQTIIGSNHKLSRGSGQQRVTHRMAAVWARNSFLRY